MFLFGIIVNNKNGKFIVVMFSKCFGIVEMFCMLCINLSYVGKDG